jgi:uncharacterized protein YfkK (UPF0435 family)
MSEESSEQIPRGEHSNQKIIELEKKLTLINPKVFEGVKKEKKEQIIHSFAVSLSKTHSGPSPI